jgi:hypothetical protein
MIGTKGGKHNEGYYASYFNPGAESFLDTLVPHLVETELWDEDYPNLAEDRGIDGRWVSGWSMSCSVMTYPGIDCRAYGGPCH